MRYDHEVATTSLGHSGSSDRLVHSIENGICAFVTKYELVRILQEPGDACIKISSRNISHLGSAVFPQVGINKDRETQTISNQGRSLMRFLFRTAEYFLDAEAGEVFCELNRGCLTGCTELPIYRWRILFNEGDAMTNENNPRQSQFQYRPVFGWLSG